MVDEILKSLWLFGLHPDEANLWIAAKMLGCDYDKLPTELVRHINGVECLLGKIEKQTTIISTQVMAVIVHTYLDEEANQAVDAVCSAVDKGESILQEKGKHNALPK
jgi:hypothetical protein